MKASPECLNILIYWSKYWVDRLRRTIRRKVYTGVFYQQIHRPCHHILHQVAQTNWGLGIWSVIILSFSSRFFVCSFCLCSRSPSRDNGSVLERTYNHVWVSPEIDRVNKCDYIVLCIYMSLLSVKLSYSILFYSILFYSILDIAELKNGPTNTHSQTCHTYRQTNIFAKLVIFASNYFSPALEPVTMTTFPDISTSGAAVELEPPILISSASHQQEFLANVFVWHVLYVIYGNHTW